MDLSIKSNILLGILILACVPGNAQEPAALNWQLVKDKDAVKVYTASPTTGSFKYIKVEALLDGTIEKFVSVFKNVASQPQWVYKTKKAYIIRANTATDLLYYNETSLPWPMSNRDIAIHMKITEDKANRQLFITSEGVQAAIPVNGNIVRVPHYQGDWTVRDAGANKIQVHYFLDIDPGGTMPAWIINLFITKGPYETFISLAEQLKK
jgi:hypothetical protein